MANAPMRPLLFSLSRSPRRPPPAIRKPGDRAALVRLLPRNQRRGAPLEAAVNRPGRTPGILEAWLADPHPPMPSLSLSRTEISDLVAYLNGLYKGH